MLGVELVSCGVYETLYALTQQTRPATGAREHFDLDLAANAVRVVPRLTAYDQPAKSLGAVLFGVADSDGGECD
ncbi:hypothetical protein [Burkholderia vietnamiensis]|uniref:hypothetical protein n=1 Tax=Burkholderia vietnamiensis TaxID=60552 RepID=UPI000B2E5B23|nr:hypothetical protein [Burkholderia vietnamiensis]MCA7984883.1 hypothetical protein [Burkholderia vietnamiensis]HDR8930519.1 hypothetical protein [Burkholderia vietnamiensis]